MPLLHTFFFHIIITIQNAFDETYKFFGFKNYFQFSHPDALPFFNIFMADAFTLLLKNNEFKIIRLQKKKKKNLLFLQVE